MDCRLWNFSSKTLMLAVLCACVFDMSRTFGAGQERGTTTTEGVVENLTSVDSGDIQVAPSPKKTSSSSVSKTQKKRRSSKTVQKLNVPATLGANKSLRKSEAELDKIFATRSVKSSNYVQYGPSANVANQGSFPVGSLNGASKSQTTSTSKSLTTNAPYVEQANPIEQTSALTPDIIEPTVSERYPLFEEDALTQESVPLVDELGGAAPKKDSDVSNGLESLPRPTKKSVDLSTDKSSGALFGNSETERNESSVPFASPKSNVSYFSPKVVQPTNAFDDRFTRYTGLFADFEWLGWQTDSIKQTYAVSDGEDNRVYDELSLRPSGSGYRGRLGLRTAYGWDLTGVYTTFDADKSGNVKSGAGNLYASSEKAVDEISSAADVKLGVYDIEVGRWITRRQWAIRPFAGVRWTRLDQTQNVGSWNNVVETQGADETYLVSFDNLENSDPNAQEIVKDGYESVWMRSKSDMRGLRLGAEGSVALFRNLSVYGKSAATIAVGDVSFQTATRSAEGDSTIRRAEKNCATPSFETAVGLAWRRNGFEVKGGYEFNVWSNAASLNGKTSDFGASGFFAGIAWNN